MMMMQQQSQAQMHAQMQQQQQFQQFQAMQQLQLQQFQQSMQNQLVVMDQSAGKTDKILWRLVKDHQAMKKYKHAENEGIKRSDFDGEAAVVADIAGIEFYVLRIS